MGAREESTDERLARELVSSHIGARVEQHDDGSADAMPDARIDYLDGRTGWLEVVTDRDAQDQSLRAAIRRRGALSIMDLRWSWAVYLRHGVLLKTIETWLPPLLREAEEQAPGDPMSASKIVRAADHRIQGASAHDAPHGGSVMLFPGPLWASSQGVGELVGWLESTLARHGDVARKMARAEPADERHAFFWVTEVSSAAWAMTFASCGRDLSLPVEQPQPPEPITHVWVAGRGNDDRCVAWFPDRGWHDVVDHWTETHTGREVIAGRVRAEGRLRIPTDETRPRPPRI